MMLIRLVVPFHLLRFNEEASRAAENSMKRWILTGGWRDASYLHEPGRCHPASPIGRMCDDLEEIAYVPRLYQLRSY